MSANQSLIEAEDIRSPGVNALSYTDATTGNEVTLKEGRYYFYATTDCWITRGAAGGTGGTTGSTAAFLPAGMAWPVVVSRQDVVGVGHETRNTFVAVRVAASGTLYITRVDRG